MKESTNAEKLYSVMYAHEEIRETDPNIYNCVYAALKASIYKKYKRNTHIATLAKHLRVLFEDPATTGEGKELIRSVMLKAYKRN